MLTVLFLEPLQTLLLAGDRYEHPPKQSLSKNKIVHAVCIRCSFAPFLSRLASQVRVSVRVWGVGHWYPAVTV